MVSTLLQVDPLCAGNSFNFISMYILLSTSLWLLTLLEFLQFVFVNFNVYDELAISKLKPHKACTETATV